MLAKALQGGSDDERRALKALLDKAGVMGLQGNREEDEPRDSGAPRDSGVPRNSCAPYSTPASTGFDVSAFMDRLPQGIEREKVRNMTFADIKTVMDMSSHMGMEERGGEVQGRH